MEWHFSSHKYDVVCKQYSRVKYTIVGEEDCLSLNVYAPSGNTQNLPVIVFMHGGGFYWGRNVDALYNPKYLVLKNAVVVTVNYRVGAFGFLCLCTNDAPGNVGLKDQIAALKWVNSNIARFGGNPACVTIFGQNAGAVSVNYLILSKKADGLFHRVIMDSGSISFPYAFDTDPVGTAAFVATRLGYNTTDPNELFKIFTNSSADDITRASYVNARNNALAPYVFRPCLESTSTRNPLILEDPKSLLRSSISLPKIEIIFGFNNKEGIMWASDYDLEGLRALDRNFSAAIPAYLKFRNSESKLNFIADVKKFFFNNKPIEYDGLVNYYTVALVTYPSVVTMEEMLKNSRISMYNYYFIVSSFRNLNKQVSRLPALSGANNADELFYIFDPQQYRFLIPSIEDLRTITTMTSFWTSFAENGIPRSFPNCTTWSKSEKTLQFLKIDKDLEMIGLPNSNQIDFWKTLIRKYTVS